MLNLIMSFIIGALVLIVALPLLFLKALHRRFRNPAAPSGREGEVTVSGSDATAGEKVIGDNIGEYVDYEEVDDNGKK